MDRFKIDSHKLIYHIDRVSDWLKGKNIYPLYLEVAPSGACNHRCTYCALDYIGYKPKFLNTDLLKVRLSEMARLGIKSIMYAGEGEPFLHKDIASIINYTKEMGIDVAITTNAVLLSKNLIDVVLKRITWIKASIDGATKKTYARIHRTDPADFDRAIKNMSYAARLKRKKGYKCALGMQFLLLPENSQEAVKLAKIARDIGMDYFVVKPYSHHPFSRTSRYRHIKYSKYLYLADKLKNLNTHNFSVIFRIETMKKWDRPERNYKHCLALSFWTYIDAGGNVWACSVYLSKKEFYIGNIYKNTFKEIFEGKKRARLMRWAAEELDTTQCRINCRMDEVNRYLWDLKHPPEHVNFI